MPTLIRASDIWGSGTLVRELGADPARLQARFGITQPPSTGRTRSSSSSRAQSLQDGLGTMTRHLYVHSPALKLAVESHRAGTDRKFTY